MEGSRTSTVRRERPLGSPSSCMAEPAKTERPEDVASGSAVPALNTIRAAGCGMQLGSKPSAAGAGLCPAGRLANRETTASRNASAAPGVVAPRQADRRRPARQDGAGRLHVRDGHRPRGAVRQVVFDLKSATAHADDQALHEHASLYVVAHGVGLGDERGEGGGAIPRRRSRRNNRARRMRTHRKSVGSSPRHGIRERPDATFAQWHDDRLERER